jgi:hypothetical protein
MANENAARRKNATRDKFDELTAVLRAENPAVADWLEEAQKGLAEIFGANPGDVWETLAFLHYMWVLLDTVEQMQLRRMLPTISHEAYDEASREWNEPTARNSVEREILRALNTFRHELYADFEAVLSGAPVENDGAKAYCRGAFTKLLRMIRLSSR